MESREQGYEDDRFETDVSRNLHCAICLNVFKDPVMCQRNQHCFCRPCITRHLKNSPTCPTCMEELRPDTLNEAPRILTDCLSELNIHCEYFNRGCLEFVQLGDVESHVKNCGFSPVVCSNQGCLVEINKRDQTHHETEVCEFRKVKCHECVELRKDMDKMKTTLTGKLDKIRGEITDEIRDEMKVNQTGVNEEIGEMKMNLREIKEQLATLTHHLVHNIHVGKEAATHQTHEAKIDPRKTKSNVVISGGFNGKRRLNSVEKFCWSTESWSPLQSMKECRQEASSFAFKNEMVVTGGYTGEFFTDTMEKVNIEPAMYSDQCFRFPAKLPGKLCGHSSVVHNERLLVIGGYNGTEYFDSIHEVLLVPPYTAKLLARLPEKRCCFGSELFNDKILICGGTKTRNCRDSVDSVIVYDITKNECKQMLPLPYDVCKMATVSWGDNVIVIGGAGKDGRALNTVVIYNVKTEKSHMLPAMKTRRKGCVAVVVSNTIVVMGGMDERENVLNSVESFNFDHYSWEDLPSMCEARYEAFPVAW